MKLELLQNQTSFTKFFFRVRGETFVPGDHYARIDEVLDKIERGCLYNDKGEQCTIIVVTVMPRSGKTQYISIDWPARCLAKNPAAKFIHLSYSDDLALDNSAKCRETITCADYQNLWPLRLKTDADSKKKWYTEQGGGMYATAAGGPVTGFGAGSVSDGVSKQDDEFAAFFAGREEVVATDDGKFYGAIIIDDPIKVEDAYAEKERNRVNNRLNSTIKSRRNNRKTPIVIVMQRLHEDDMAGFVLGGGMHEPVYHLNLPAINTDGTALWPHKHTIEELEQMRLADYGVFMSQYMQDPTPATGTYFKAEWFGPESRFRLGQEPTRLVKYGAGDYAVTDEKVRKDADYTEQAIAGFDIKEDLWFLDWKTARETLDKSIDKMMELFGDHDPMLWAAESGVIRRAMEPFILKEQQRRRQFFTLVWLPATKSKAANAKAFQALCSQGKVHIPLGPWGDELIAQLLKFTGQDDKHDDKVDVCGIFGRLLDQTFGPAQYHNDLKDKAEGDDDYGVGETDDEANDWRVT
jgi:predicted phage terminase large subunit-like protein